MRLTREATINPNSVVSVLANPDAKLCLPLARFRAVPLRRLPWQILQPVIRIEHNFADLLKLFDTGSP